ncbi:tetratricopeptide repeat protein, partial [Dehalococcoidia bacterium]|nr:tetratricopeptide repeat protein [Dehalococcoidia bacterium]
MAAEDWIKKSRDFLDEGDNEKAEKALLEAISVDPLNAQTWFNLSISLNNQERYPDGENAALEATQLDPEFVLAWNSYGWALLNQQKHDEADRAFLCAIELDPTYPNAFFNYNESLIEQERYTEAESILQALSLDDPLNSTIWYELGRTRRLNEDYSGAADAYIRATEIDTNDAEAWKDLGCTYDALDDHSSAEVAYLQATIADPDDPFLWYCLGFCRRKQGKNTEAVEAFRTAADLGIDNPELWDHLGREFGDLNELTASKNAFLRSIELSPEESRTWFHLGIACDALEETSEAEDAYLESVRLDPNNADAWSNLGALRSGHDQLVRAEEATLQAINTNQSDYIAWANLGLILKRQKRYLEAEHAAQRSLRLNPSNQIIVTCWHTIANSRWWQGKPHTQTIKAYRNMADAIEILRKEFSQLDLRLTEFQKPAECLREAAIYGLGSGTNLYWQESLLFTIRSKARIYGELLDHHPSQLGELLTIEERDKLARLEESYQNIQMQRHSWRSVPEAIYQIGSDANLSSQELSPPDQGQELEISRKSIDDQSESFLRQAIISHPELEPFILGPKPQSLRFSLKKLKKRLRPTEAILELLFDQQEPILLLGFMLGREGLVGTYLQTHNDPMNSQAGPTLEGWRNDVISTLHIGEGNRAADIKRDLTPEVLTRWGQLLYGPFMDDLKDITRLWISPHSFLTQLPFNAIPFPDGIEREVAIIPSAASLTR